MRLGAISLWLLACGCAAFPQERGERLEQRLQRLEEGGDAGQLEAQRAEARKQIQELEARVAEVQKRLDALAAAPKREGGAGGDAAARKQLAEEVGRHDTALEEQARRVSAIEKALAQLQAGAEEERRRAAARTPKAPARAAAEPPPRPAPAAPAPAAEPPREKAGYLAFAREQEAKGQKEVARDLYEQYVASFPDDPSAAEAHFRLGELAFGERRYRDAIGEYGKIAQGFPKSSHAPDALLRTAESMVQMGHKEEAATVLSEIPKRYPNTPAASRANRRLAEVGGASGRR